MKWLSNMAPERRREVCGVFLLTLTILLFLVLVTDGYQGDIRRPLNGMEHVPNALGVPGSITAGMLTLLFGYAAHILYCILGIWGCMLLRHSPLDRLPTRIAGLFLLVFSVSLLLHVDAPLVQELSEEGSAQAESVSAMPTGGVFGAFFADMLTPYIGVIGVNVIGISLALVGILLATEFLLLHVFVEARVLVAGIVRTLTTFFKALSAAIMVLVRQGIGATQNRTKKPARKSKSRKREVEEPEAPEPVASHDDHPWMLHIPEGDEVGVAPRESREPQSVNRSNDDTDITGLFASEPDLPFDDIPGTPERAGNERQPVINDFAALDTQELPFDGADASDETPDDVPVQPEIEPAPAQLELTAAAYEGDRQKPLPRRKTIVEEELPPDYVYPRRYTKPSLDIFEPPPPRSNEDMGQKLLRTSALLEETFKTFGIEARVTEVTRGPTITRFELEPAPGVKVSRFVSLADDLALALKAHRVRVEAPIPGKGRVGIEVPNAHREPVVVRELLESRRFQNSQGELNLVLGKDISGDVVVADLATMPHLLVAGATGAGKTVCVKTMIASLLTNKTPDELQVIFIDPKMVELSIFNDIPHLITPVVTDPKKAAIALRWLINEMEERYRLFSHLRVRNIEVYNTSVENGEIEMPEEEGTDPESMDVIRKLPYIVCIIDELADLMMLARAEVEDAIARLAQLARAVGIHLIIATQRPSVDVLTGVIKANFPARMSFQVSSKVDSRCILDQIGAERLIGRGDMLYLPAGQSKPTRVQGAFVSDEEMNSLIAYLKTQAPPQYKDEIAGFEGNKEGYNAADDQDDELFEDAVRVVLETGQASISMVQRRLRVGYTRAARLIDMMEMRGIVGPHVGSKAREILVQASPNDEVA